jgi:hypothetical protein
MRFTSVLQQFFKLVRSDSETSSVVRASEQRDQSSMADFVRILQNHDGKKPN